VELIIHSAQGLRGRKHGKLADPYVIIRLEGKEEEVWAQTSVVKHNQNPSWNSSHKIPYLKDNDKILLEIHHWDKFSGDFLGAVVITVKPQDGDVANQTLKLESRKDNQKDKDITGTIVVSLKYTPIVYNQNGKENGNKEEEEEEEEEENENENEKSESGKEEKEEKEHNNNDNKNKKQQQNNNNNNNNRNENENNVNEDAGAPNLEGID